MHEPKVAAISVVFDFEAEAVPVEFELESAMAPDTPELESSAEPTTPGLESKKSTAAPVTVELESAGAPAVVELKVAAMLSALDLDTGVVHASVELEAAAEAAGAFESEAAPVNRTRPASLNLDVSPSGRNTRDEAPVFTLGAKGLQGNFAMGTTAAAVELESAPAPALLELEFPAELTTLGLESTAAPDSVEHDPAMAPAMVKLRVAAMPSALDVDA